MTREETKNIVRHIFHFYEVNAENCNWTDMNEACGEIFKALEQEPCEDAISRQAVINMMNYGILEDNIETLPSVTPQPKTGHWINYKDEHQCSSCNEMVVVDYYLWKDDEYDFCPYCGAEMQEVE